MLVNNFPVHFSLTPDQEVCITFNNHQGTLLELQKFRQSFDYQYYKFGTGRFTSAQWKTIEADDNGHCKYPRQVGLVNDKKQHITLSWDTLNELISNAMVFAIKNKVSDLKS